MTTDISFRRARTHIVLIATLLAVAALGACGGDDTSPSAAGNAAPTSAASSPTEPSTDAGSGSGSGGTVTCASDADVEAAVGTAVKRTPGVGDEDGCNYYSDDFAVSVGVVFEDPTTRTVEDVERNMNVDRVEGVGDAAYETVMPGGIVQFGVFADGRHVLVTIQGIEPDPAAARAVYDLFA